MSDVFKDREKSFEAKYKMDQELAFKIAARRNKLLGEWLADKFGMTSDEKAEYARTVVMADLDEPGDEDVMRKVLADVADHGADVPEQDVRSKFGELEAIAAEQIRGAAPPNH
jgi:hypothetical protein